MSASAEFSGLISYHDRFHPVSGRALPQQVHETGIELNQVCIVRIPTSSVTLSILAS